MWWFYSKIHSEMIFCRLCVWWSQYCIKLHKSEKKAAKSLFLFLISHKGPFFIVLVRFFLKLGITTKRAFIYFDIVKPFTSQAPPLILILFTLTDLYTSFFRTFLMLWFLLYFLLLFLLLFCLLFWTDYLSSVSITHTWVHDLIFCLNVNI